MFRGAGERNRVLYVLKSRGMAHSNQVREFMITSEGIRLVEVYTGPDGISVVGSARIAREAELEQEELRREQEVERRKRDLERMRQKVEAQIESLRRARRRDGCRTPARAPGRRA